MFAPRGEGAAQFDLVGNGANGKPYLSLVANQAAVTGVSISGDSVSDSAGYRDFTMTFDPAGFGLNAEAVSPSYDLVRQKASGPTTRRVESGANVGSGANSGIYLRLDSAIEGDRQDRGYEIWIEIDSAQMGVGRAFYPNPGEPDRPSTTISELSWSQSFDGTVPIVLSNLLQGQSIGQATIEYVRNGNNGPVTFMQLALEDVLFSSLSLSTGGALASVSASMRFTAFSQTVWQILPDGTCGISTSVGYNIAKGGADRVPSPPGSLVSVPATRRRCWRCPSHRPGR